MQRQTGVYRDPPFNQCPPTTTTISTTTTTTSTTTITSSSTNISNTTIASSTTTISTTTFTTTTMKFATFALALLLAVGSHAVPVEVPTQVDHARAVVDLYLVQLKNSATNSLNHLEGTEFVKYKVQLLDSLNTLYTNLKEAQALAIPHTNAVISQIMEATADARTAITADVDALTAELQPRRENLKNVLNLHIAKYREMLEPIVDEYAKKHKEDMTQLKAKLEPKIAELSALVNTNVEETKQALMPIIESVRNKLSERLVMLRAAARPYVEEYEEQLKKVIADAQVASSTLNFADIRAQVDPHIAELKKKSEPLWVEIQAKLGLAYAAITEAVNKN
ncbi:hypothetical protein CRUP_026415 [Coryphaenoides rupestris]|nr:hypothetical protein CRUP_026415 [Coryphaenoides rupestris]